MFGSDANWGRILCAIGYSGADVDVTRIDVSFRSSKGTVAVCQNGAGIPFSEEEAKKILLENEIEILVCLNSGTAAGITSGNRQCCFLLHQCLLHKLLIYNVLGHGEQPAGGSFNILLPENRTDYRNAVNSRSGKIQRILLRDSADGNHRNVHCSGNCF